MSEAVAVAWRSFLRLAQEGRDATQEQLREAAREAVVNALCAAEEAVRRLLECSRKGGPLYQSNPRVVAHVSRTGKWHLNAITSFRKAPGRARLPSPLPGPTPLFPRQARSALTPL